MNNLIIYILSIIILMASPLSALVQQGEKRASGEVLALDQAIALALRNNHSVI